MQGGELGQLSPLQQMGPYSFHVVVRPGGVCLGKIHKPPSDFVDKEDDLIVVDFALGEEGRSTDGLTVVEVCSFFLDFLDHVLTDKRIVHICPSLAGGQQNFDQEKGRGVA